MAERIQLRRTKGWRKPEGAVVCTRPGKYGNPYQGANRQLNARLFRVAIVARQRGKLRPLHHMNDYPSDNTIRRELAGKDLACWCPEGDPDCHVETLLAVANGWKL